MGFKLYSDHGLHWWNEGTKRVVYQLTIEKILPYIRDRKGKLIDIGCGLGHVTHMLAKETKMRVIGTDYERPCIGYAKKHFKRKNLSYRRENAFKLKGKYDVIVSTGHVSVGSFPGMAPRLRKALKEDGLLILDFRRDYDLYTILLGSFFDRLREYRQRKDGWYHLGWIGIRRYYEQQGFEIVDKKKFFVSPPGLPYGMRMFLEHYFNWLLAPLFARVIIVVLRKS